MSELFNLCIICTPHTTGVGIHRLNLFICVRARDDFEIVSNGIACRVNKAVSLACFPVLDLLKNKERFHSKGRIQAATSSPHVN